MINRWTTDLKQIIMDSFNEFGIDGLDKIVYNVNNQLYEYKRTQPHINEKATPRGVLFQLKKMGLIDDDTLQQQNKKAIYQYQAEHYVNRYVSKKIKKKLLEGAICVKCGSNDNLTIDHIIAISKGGTNLEDNLQVLCKPCNSSKNNYSNDDFIRGSLRSQSFIDKVLEHSLDNESGLSLSQKAKKTYNLRAEGTPSLLSLLKEKQPR